jgi:hypothetical protein
MFAGAGGRAAAGRPKRMEFLKDRRVIALGGAGLALVLGLGAAWLLFSRSPAPSGPPPASQGGLVVVSGRDDDARLDPKRPLRCFVGGQFVGELPLAVCAQRNGVATGSLDVGLDPSGALAAATNAAGSGLTPLPSQAPPQSLPVTEPDDDGVNAARPGVLADAGAGQPCWRWQTGGWRKLPTPLPRQACVQAVFAGRCPGPDTTFYGRWGDETLRLMGGRIEVSYDNRDFSSLIDPWPPCATEPG